MVDREIFLRLSVGKATAIVLVIILSSALSFGHSAPQVSLLYFMEGQLVQIIDYTYTVNVTRGSDGTAIVNIPFLPSIQEQGYRQEVIQQEISTTPYTPLSAHYDKYDGFDCPYVKFTWENAPPWALAKRSARVKHTVEYRPFVTNAPFPIDRQLFSADISPFIQPQNMIQSDDPEIRALAQTLTYGALCQMDAVARVLNWVRANIKYACPTAGGFTFADAANTLKYRIGNCVNFANLAVALLRAAGIPAVCTFGFVADRPQSSAGHAWLAVLYPDLGWVEYESSYWMPTGGLVPKTFLMPRHITVYAPPMSEFGVSGNEFSELHEANWTTISTPTRTEFVRCEVLLDEFICFPLVAEGKEYQILELSWSDPPAGWRVSSSVSHLNFSNSAVETFLLTVATPRTGEVAWNMSVRLLTPSGTKVGEVVIEFSSPPTIYDVSPLPNSFVGARPRIEVRYGSQRSGIDLGKTNVKLDGVDVTQQSTLSPEGLQVMLLGDLKDGTHTVRVEVWDQEGNSKTKEWSFVVDATPPSISIVSPGEGSTVTEKRARIEVILRDDGSGVDLATARMWLDGSPVVASMSGDTMTFLTAELSEGTHRVKVEVKDKLGNIGSKEWSFEVKTPLFDVPTLVVVAVLIGSAAIGAAYLFKRRQGRMPLPPPPPPLE